jgi:nitrogen fixation/metabolism regulation signal transduction histidine kinase
VAVALIPLFLFTLSARGFFARAFTQQLTDKAEAHADFAQSVMEDFIFLEQEDAQRNLPPDNIVLWISSTISKDVNLYRDGKLISSSRREFFDYGLLPELIDGEIYFKVQYENNPFYTQTQKIGDYTFHTLTIPYNFEGSQFLISLPFPLERQELNKATEELIEFLFLISIFFIAGVIVFARGIGGMILRPIQKLLSGTREVSLGNLEFSIDYKNRDEMKTLIDGFNTMINSLKRHQQELADMSKKVAWAEMARKVAHEIKNPLTPIQLSAEHIQTVYKEDPDNIGRVLKESTSYIISEVEHLRKIAHEFMELSQASELRMKPLDLREIIGLTINPYKKVLAHRISFRESYEGEHFPIHGDQAKLTVALKNLFTNAIEAIREKGTIQISVIRRESSLVLQIEDNGMGIDKKNIAKIFDTYFSTKDVGTGLGLPISKKIIEDHGGTLQIKSRIGEGTTIIIHLPIREGN